MILWKAIIYFIYLAWSGYHFFDDEVNELEKRFYLLRVFIKVDAPWVYGVISDDTNTIKSLLNSRRESISYKFTNICI